MPTFDELDALIAEARSAVTGAEFARGKGIGMPTDSLERMVTRLADALSALRDTNPDKDAEPEWVPLWVDGLRHDGTYEYTTSSDCDGSDVKHWRRTPEFGIEAGQWHPVPSSPEGSK